MAEHSQTGGLAGLAYAVVYEWAGANFSAYSPDVPGCIATGATIAEVRTHMREALAFHIESLALHGEDIPEARATVETLAL